MEKKKEKPKLLFFFVVIPLRLERKTYCLEGSCSIQLSYGTDLILIKSAAKLVRFIGFSKKKRNYLSLYCIFALCIQNNQYKDRDMSLLGNLVWLIFGGLAMSFAYLILGLGYCITIIGIPVGLQLFKLASLSLMPFGRDAVTTHGDMGCGSIILNVLWLIFGGVEMALTHLGLGLLFCITIVGIPFGMQHFKLALLALMPFGKDIV